MALYDHPSVQRLVRIAAALDELTQEVVFIGGAVAPLLHTDPQFDQPRPTKDVDGIVASSGYGDVGRLEDCLRAKRFKQSSDIAGHAHRWLSPDGDLFDLVPAGDHFGGAGNRWDVVALNTAVELRLPTGRTIRHASGPAFLALKWAAYRDRGHDDPLLSHDLEDICALLAARPTLLAELEVASSEVQIFVVDEVRELLASGFIEDLLAAHLNNAQDPAAAQLAVFATLRRIAELKIA